MTDGNNLRAVQTDTISLYDLTVTVREPTIKALEAADPEDFDRYVEQAIRLREWLENDEEMLPMDDHELEELLAEEG